MSFVRPDNPGTRIGFVGDLAASVEPSLAATVAVPITHDWGPLGSDEEGGTVLGSFAAFEALYGTSDTAGRRAVLSAFNGSGLPGQGGAGGVLVYRMATGAAAKAAVTLQNTTPVNAITFTAKWTGDNGENISIVKEDDPTDNTRDQVRILYKGVEVERYRYAQTDITALAALINNRPSKYVTATVAQSGVALTATAGTALTAGADGASITATEYTAMLSAMEFAPFAVLAPQNLTDAAIRQQILAFVRTQAEEMRPVFAVFGGAAGEDSAAAMARSALVADPHVINVGVGTWHDDLLDADVSTAQLAPRIAGIFVARGENSALTYADIAGLTAVGDTGPATDELKPLADAGVTVFRRVSAVEGRLKIARGVTTWTVDDETDDRPAEIWSEPRYLMVMDNYIRAMREWGDDNIVGDVRVTDDSRAAVGGHARGLQDDLERRQLILPGTGLVNVPVPEDPDLEDAIPYEFGWKFARTANYLLGNGRVR